MWQAKKANPFKTAADTAGVYSPHCTFTKISFNAIRSIRDAKFRSGTKQTATPLMANKITVIHTASDCRSVFNISQWLMITSMYCPKSLLGFPILFQTSQALAYCNAGERSSTDECLFLFPAASSYSCSSPGADTVISELLQVRKLCAAYLCSQSPGYFLLECLAYL